MKKVISMLLVCCLCAGFCACGSQPSTPTEPEDPNARIKEMLSGEWIYKAYPDNPFYMFLNFDGDTVRYGTKLFGEEVESGTWDCSYTIDGNALKLTTADGTDFDFTIQDNGDSVRIFNDDGDEFLRSE